MKITDRVIGLFSHLLEEKLLKKESFASDRQKKNVGEDC
jgi:hypothetical protein